MQMVQNSKGIKGNTVKSKSPLFSQDLRTRCGRENLPFYKRKCSVVVVFKYHGKPIVSPLAL